MVVSVVTSRWINISLTPLNIFQGLISPTPTLTHTFWNSLPSSHALIPNTSSLIQPWWLLRLETQMSHWTAGIFYQYENSYMQREDYNKLGYIHHPALMLINFPPVFVHPQPHPHALSPPWPQYLSPKGKFFRKHHWTTFSWLKMLWPLLTASDCWFSPGYLKDTGNKAP